MTHIKVWALVLALPAFATPDGGLDVELLDAGSVLPTQMVCMPGEDAMKLDNGLRDAEASRDRLKTWVVVAPLVALVVGAVAGVVVGLEVKK